MTNIVVDSNIVFSALVRVNSRIANILIEGISHYDFYAPNYLKKEIMDHTEKICKIGNLALKDFPRLLDIVTEHIRFINTSLIPQKDHRLAEELCAGIDIDDKDFVATALHKTAILWTGDKKLMKGLKSQGFDQVIDTNRLYEDFLLKKGGIGNEE